MRYDEGYTSFLEVLDAERSLFNVELAHTASQNVLFRSLINIYKSMGGGWVDQAEQEYASSAGDGGGLHTLKIRKTFSILA